MLWIGFLLSPNHFIYDCNVGLDDFDYDVGYVFADIDIDGGAVVVVGIHGYGCFYGLEEGFFIDAGEDEACIVKGLGALGGGADADSGEWVADGGEEAALFGEGAGVGDDGGGVHLQAIVVVEAEGLVTNYAWVELEAGLLKALAAAGMAAVEDGHVVTLSDGVDGVEEGEEVFLGVNIFFAMGGEEDVFSFFKAEPLMDIACFNVCKILVKYFGHWRTGNVGALFGKSTISEIAACMLGVAEVDIGDDVNNTAVCFFRETFILAAVAGFHMEDGYMESLCCDCGEAGIGVAEDEECIGFDVNHEFVGAVDDVAYGGSEVVTDGIHIHFGIGELEVFEEYAVEIVVVVLACVCEHYIKVFAAFVDGGCEADDFRTRANDYKEFKFAVVGKMDVCIISFHFTESKNVSGWLGLKISLQYITVTRSSVGERLMMLWV